ncbi:hypothetical protein B0G80_4409 [Paraburkholderia sp. BL6669N2]|uniref:hypothetical protein n=1 Tax=Paraburkholderia sp. BL6669N2 TaxID=1938807 RepID=UPI000E25ADAC|nr:hypothetical protein [Paraburkholderia sp. BL6669N2]REG61556.1 hypothetical protein B0G80_4409 [Paraburkholderia sp. BL6669N2]
MTRRRIIFHNKTVAPAAAARVSALPVMFVKAAPDPLEAVDWTASITHAQLGMLIKAAHVGDIDMSDLARAAEASLRRRPVPEDLRRVIVGTHLDPL